MEQGLVRKVWGALFGPECVTERLAGELDALARFDAVPAGAMVLTEDQCATDLVALAHGDAAIGVQVHDGEHDGGFVAERGVSAPGWLDACSAWHGGHYVRAVQATTPSQVVRLPVAAIRQLTVQHPQVGTHLLELLSDEVGRLSVEVRDLLQKDAEARLASWLIRRLEAAAPGQGTDEIQLTERKRQIATQLGVQPETLSRLLRALNRKGLVEVFGYRVRVLDSQGLKQLAAG